MSIREAIVRFKELHEDFKKGEFKSPEARKFYESEREEFARALVQAQQLAIRPGQAARQALRVAREERLVVILGARREGTLTLDVGSGGFAALVGPLAISITCNFELFSDPDTVRGRARVVACTRLPDGTYRTSFAVDSMPPEEKARLETWVIDAALAGVAR
jgi:hypothetical protein